MWLNNIVALLVTRHIRSFYYRVILILYGLIILLSFPNLMPCWVYILTLSFYTMFYVYYFTSSSDRQSWIRNLFDSFFIGVCLIGKPLDNIAVITMLFIPVANAINHTGRFEGKGSKLYVFWLISLYFLLFFLEPHKAVEFSDIIYALVAFLGLFLIHCNTFREWSYVNKTAELYDTIDKLYMYQSDYSEVYQNIIDICSQKERLCKFILCFASHDNYRSSHIINGSQFITSYSLNLEAKEQSRLLHGRSVYNAKIVIEGKQYNYNLLIPKKIRYTSDGCSQLMYLFVLIFENNRISYKTFEVSLDTLLYRLSNYFFAQHRIRQRRLSYYEQISKKSRFVDSAINAMHFIKNRLTSVQTLTDLINDKDFDSNNKDYMHLIKQTAKRSQIDINQILDKSRYLLNKDNNPFFYQIVEEANPVSIYEILDNIWSSNFPHIKIEANSLNNLNLEHSKIETNLEALEILFSDIIGNMVKYKNAFCACRISFHSNSIVIDFENDTTDHERVLNLVRGYNDSSRAEILKRKTYGVSNIKSIVANLNIDLYADLRFAYDFGHVFQLKLVFKIKENENINH